MNENELKATLQFAVMNAQLKALEKTLNDEQLKVYYDSIEKSKIKYLRHFGELPIELQKLIDDSFPSAGSDN